MRVPRLFAIGLLLWACTTDNPGGDDDDAGLAARDAAPPTPDLGVCIAGAACEDGDPCTLGDRCTGDGLVCRGAPRVCDDDDPCTVDRCDPATGTCLGDRVPLSGAEGAPGQARCANGQDDDCDGDTDAADPDCRTCTADADCLDPDPCAAERCVDGRCESFAVGAVPMACDDGDLCTDGDRCRDGRCAGEARACPATGDPCLAPACDGPTGECREIPVPDGTACDDGDACTVEDACLGGVCGGGPRDCAHLDGPCVLGVCDASGDCLPVPRSDGVPCEAGRCEPGAVCRAGDCAGDAVDCGDLSGPCRAGLCDPETGGCDVAALPEGTACDDGDPCTEGDQCGPRGCAGRPRDCAGLAGACATPRCDPASGACVADLEPNGTPCDDGRGCTQDDRCLDGLCAGTDLECEGRAAACRVRRCDEGSGQCVDVDAEDGTPCDDNDLCTEGDTCRAGQCASAPRPCDDGRACTRDVCDPARGACVHEPVPLDRPEGAPGSPECADGTDDDCDGRVDLADPDCRACATDDDCADDDPCTELTCARGRCALEAGAADGRACDDGDACTAGDVCRADRCTGAGVDCSPIDGACARGVCDPGTGACVPRPIADGVACDDDDGCTVGDACREGACAGEPRDCRGLDGECQIGRCEDGACRGAPREDGTPCNDADRCTQADVCREGACGGGPVDCVVLDGPCVIGRCDPNSGACAVEQRPAGAGCDDGDPCTIDDACAAGACVGRPRDCGALDGACVVGRCDPANGECRPVPRRDGTPCDDGSACTAMDACAGGACGGPERDCSEFDGSCTEGVCDPRTGRCEPRPLAEGTPCEDGARCTADDRCADGRCAGSLVDCSRLDSGCAAGFCDPATGACDARPVPDGIACDDGQACTDGDVCRSGICVGDGLDCRDLDAPCVAGQCDPQAGDCRAVPVADGMPCDPSDLCVIGATCAGGRCEGDAQDCGALDRPCIVGTCDPATGACAAERLPDGEGCDDGDACTVEDRCDGGRCLGRSRSCADQDGPCTVGRCDPDRGCVAVPRADGTACDTGDACLVEEACRAGQCTGTPVRCPDPDPNPCRAAACNPANGRCEPANVADGTGCEDGQYCSVGDVCQAGRCSGSARDCNPPGEPCRRGSCNEARDRCDVGNVEDGRACDDGQFCSVGDRCVRGVCRATGERDCPDANQGCLDGVCDEGGDRCTHEPDGDGTLCLDGDPCTLGDRCRAGECAPGVRVCP